MIRHGTAERDAFALMQAARQIWNRAMSLQDRIDRRRDEDAESGMRREPDETSARAMFQIMREFERLRDTLKTLIRTQYPEIEQKLQWTRDLAYFIEGHDDLRLRTTTGARASDLAFLPIMGDGAEASAEPLESWVHRLSGSNIVASIPELAMIIQTRDQSPLSMQILRELYRISGGTTTESGGGAKNTLFQSSIEEMEDWFTRFVFRNQ